MFASAFAWSAYASSKVTFTNESQPRFMSSAGARPVAGSRGKPRSTHALKPFRTNAPFTRRSP
jgi:hypothetical protein